MERGEVIGAHLDIVGGTNACDKSAGADRTRGGRRETSDGVCQCGSLCAARFCLCGGGDHRRQWRLLIVRPWHGGEACAEGLLRGL